MIITSRSISRAIILPVTLAFAACSDNHMPEPEPTPSEPEEQVVDLSVDEMANCYIVSEPGEYIFKADNQFNLGEGLPVPPEINPVSAQLVWQTEESSITEVGLIIIDNTPYIHFEVAKASGNALIAATDSEGSPVWSWHIWMPETEIYAVTSTTGYGIMNLNLGAVTDTPGNPQSYGLLYQWGRKDPFPAAATLTGDTNTVSAPMFDIDNNPVSISHSSWTDNSNNTIEYSISHPTVCLSNYSQYASSHDWLRSSDDSLWGNPNGHDPAGGENKFPHKGRKTCYDPSPAGWRIAPPDAFVGFTTSGGFAWDFKDFAIKDVDNDGDVDIDDYNYGWYFFVNSQDALYFPAASRFDGSYAMLMGSMSGLWGNYWSNAPSSSIPGGAYCCLSFQVKGQNGEDWISVSPSGSASRADAYSIRCIRDN